MDEPKTLIAEIKIVREGNMFIGYVTQNQSLIKNGGTEVTDTFKSERTEDLLTEIKKFLEDCHDEL
jgi:hypothetical protein